MYIAKRFLLSDVYIDVPDIIDISHMRSKGHQTGEELLPDGGMRDIFCLGYIIEIFS